MIYLLGIYLVSMGTMGSIILYAMYTETQIYSIRNILLSVMSVFVPIYNTVLLLLVLFCMITEEL